MSVGNVQDLYVDLNQYNNFKPVIMKQFDKNTRTIEITLTDSDGIYTIPSGVVAKIQCTKPDGTIIFDDCIIKNDVIIYVASEQLTAIAGEVKCEIGLYEPDINNDPTKDKLLQSATFIIIVKETAMDRNAVVSSNEFNTLTIMINTISGLVEQTNTTLALIDEAITNAEEATNATNQAILDANTATTSANTATTNANNAVNLVNQTNSDIQNAESLRNTAEQTRELQEITRQTNTATAIANANTATDRANLAAQNAEDIVAGVGVIMESSKGIANGVASLDENAKVPLSQLPNIASSAQDITYDNTTSGLTSTNTQSAIDELDTKIGDLSQLQTTSNTDLVVAINENTSQLVDIAINIKSFGAKGDGITDDTQAFLDMATFCNSRSYTKVYIPSGLYKVNQQITINKNISIVGDNENESILDFSAANGEFLDNVCLLITGDIPEILPSITTNLTKNNKAMTFINSPNLKIGDIITILDSAFYSWSSYREYYRKGEMAKVISINDTTVILDNPLYDSYDSGENLKLYKLNTITSNISKIGIKLKPTIEVGTCGIMLQYCINSHISDITGCGTNYSHVSIHNCYNTTIERVNIDYSSPEIGYNYGLALSNSYKTFVNKCFLKTERHGLAIGGGDLLTDVINREFLITDCFIGSYAQTGADMHGNVEFIRYKNCVLENGVIMAGNNTEVSNCTIYTDTIGIGINLAEIKGMNHIISNNDIVCPIYSQSNSTGNGIIRCQVTNQNKDGTLAIKDNKFKQYPKGTVIGILNNNPSIKFNVFIENNELTREDKTIWGGSGIVLRGLFDVVKINSNYLSGSDIYLTPLLFSLLEIKNNISYFSSNHGLVIGVNTSITENYIIEVKNNKFIKSAITGLSIIGKDTTLGSLYLLDNIIIDSNELNPSTSSANKSNIYINNIKYVSMKNNTFGDTREVPTQAYVYYLTNINTFYDDDNNNIGNLKTVNLSAISSNLNKILFNQDMEKRVIAFRQAHPSVGDWVKGSIIYNTNTTVGQPYAWVCTSGGTSSTWNVLGQNGVNISVSSSPSFIGQIAVVGEIAYIATGTSSATDWKQISN